MKEIEKIIIEEKIDHEWVGSYFECSAGVVKGSVGDVDVEIECDTLEEFVSNLEYAVNEGIDKEGEILFKKDRDYLTLVLHTGALLDILNNAFESGPYYNIEDVGDVIHDVMYNLCDDDGLRSYTYWTSKHDTHISTNVGPVKVYLTLFSANNPTRLELDTDVDFRLPSITIDKKEEWDYDDLIYLWRLILRKFMDYYKLTKDDIRNAFNVCTNKDLFHSLERWISGKFETLKDLHYLLENANLVLEDFKNGKFEEDI